MMKNRIAIVLVLFVVLSCPVFSDQDSCKQTAEFMLGERDGKMKSFSPWGLLGFGLTAIGGLVSFATEPGGSFWQDEVLFAFLARPGIGTVISIAIPLAIKPQPEIIPDSISEDRLECYLDGYGRAARRKNIRSALGGCAAGWGFFLTLFFGSVFASF